MEEVEEGGGGVVLGGGGAQPSGNIGGGGGGGGRYGAASLTSQIFLGSGGGGGGSFSSNGTAGPTGGTGGGIIMILANNFSIGSNAIRSNGSAGTNTTDTNTGGSGGGAGGSILLNSSTAFTINTATTATGGAGGTSSSAASGAGGVGRINIGNSSNPTDSNPDASSISTTAGNIYGIALSTLTGGNTANYQLTTGTLTSIASATNYQINLGTTVGAASATFGGINTGALSGAGTTSYGINLGANTSTATTNYGINIGAISGAGTTNYGLYVGAISGATTNYGAYFAEGSTTQAGFSTSIDSEAIDLTTVSGIRTVAAIDINENNTTGTVPTIQWDSAETRCGLLDANLTGALATENLIDIDTSAAWTSNLVDITTGAQIWTGNMFDINVGAAAATGDVINIALGASAPAVQALVVTSSSSTATGGVISLAVNTAAGQSSDIIDITSTIAAMNGSDTFQGIDINITGANHTSTSNVITGIDLALTTPDADATETAINIGANWDTDINATTALDIGIDGTNEVTLSSTAFSPATTDSNALGTASLFWSDLFLASGAVVNFNGDMTITHAADNLTFAGGTTNFSGAVAYGSQQTFVDADTTPDVSSGSHWITNTTAVEITDFDAGAGALANGQIIYVESAGAVTYDFTAGNLKLGAADIVTAAGDLTVWIYDGTDWLLINWMDVSATQTGADLAEWYVSSEPLEPGDVVSIDPSDPVIVEKSKGQYDGKVMGIVSTEPGIILGPQEQNTYAIALAGRVPTKVSTENGPIEVGDYLTTSSTPGVAMKATRPGPTVGKALEAFDGSSPQGSNNNSSSTEPEASGEVQFGKILTFVNVSYADPGNFFASLSLDNEGNLIIPKMKVGSLILDPSVILKASEGSQDSNLEILRYAQNDSSKVFYDLSGKIASLEERIKDLEEIASSHSEVVETSSPRNDVAGEATSSAVIASDSEAISTPSSEEATPSADLAQSILDSLEAPEELLATGSAVIANLKVTSEATFSGKLASYDLSVSNIFKSLGQAILGNTIVAGDFTVDGTLSLTGNSINSVGTLYIQSSPLAANIDLFNGKVTINNEGILSVEKLAVSSQTLSTGTIPAGQTSIVIPSNQITENSKVFITAHKPVLISVTSKNTQVKTFTVELAAPATSDITFDWWIVDSKE